MTYSERELEFTFAKNVTISVRFICFILTVKLSAALAVCVLRATSKKGRQHFFRKKVHPVTWLDDFLTSKWPGSFNALVFAPDDLSRDLSDVEMTWLLWRPGAATGAHERYRQTDDSQTDVRWHIANVNVSSRSLKGHKVVTFRLFVEKPHCTDWNQNLNGGSSRRRNHIYASFKMIFLGVTILQGSNFPFSYWFLHGPYNSAARPTALPVSHWSAYQMAENIA